MTTTDAEDWFVDTNIYSLNSGRISYRIESSVANWLAPVRGSRP
jgi:hypothetical protein